MEQGVEAVAAISFIQITPVVVIALIVLGFFGGLLSGFIGSGGAFVLTPGMMSLGVDGLVAVASNMAHKFPKALVGVLKRRKLGHVDMRLGILMLLPAIAGVQVGIIFQKLVLDTWGKTGSDLYISVIFVIVLSSVGIYTLLDGRRAARSGIDDTTSALAEKVKKINLWPMVNFKEANSRVSLWITLPLGFATGLLAATIAVGGFIGVPSMIYVVGAPSFVASGTELVIAFGMGLTGAFTYALTGFVDFRLTAVILAGSLIGVQVGAIGTSYVKQYMIKIVAGIVMVLAGLSRVLVIPGYLSDLSIVPVADDISAALSAASLILLFTTLVGSGLIIVGAMLRGKKAAIAGTRTAVQVS